jgi:hypothetical protein
MSIAGFRIGVLFLLGFAGTAAAEPTLTVVAGGRTAIYTASGLLAMPAATSVTVAADFAYKKSMTFRGVPMAALLAGSAQDDAIRISASDGFRTTLPAAALRISPSSRRTRPGPRSSLAKPRPPGRSTLSGHAPSASRLRASSGPPASCGSKP